MKRLICLICVLACVFTLVSCKDAQTDTAVATDTTGYESETVELTEEMIAAILAWREVQAWDITSTSMMAMTDDGDTENSQGYMVGFDGCMIKGENGNMYHGDTIAMNSAVAFEIAYEMYYYDGWAYQIYKDASVEELNTYERYETTEGYFLSDFDGIVPTLATEEELKGGEAVKTGDTIVVSVALGEGRARDELIGDIEYLAQNNGISADDLTIENAAVSYAISDGKLVGYIGSYELSCYVNGVNRVFAMEKSSQINATDADVEIFTLPEDRDSYDIVGLS